MAKEPYYVQPWKKEMDAFQDFSGGLNTTVANSNLANNELADVNNLNLGTRGSLIRRSGMVKTFTAQTGTPQGYFRYYKADGTIQELTAIGGVIYLSNSPLATPSGVTLQTTRPMEAVQYLDKLYIATGSSKLLVWDGTTLSQITPYAPDPMEALYIGYNGLADDPTAVMTDGTGTTLNIMGVTMSTRYGTVNNSITLTAYSVIPTGVTVQYQFNWRKVGDTNFTLAQDWSTTKTYSFKATEAGDYEFKVSARASTDTTNTNVSDYYVPTYSVATTIDPTKEDIDATTIKNCNRILLHWDRLIMYGDTSKSDVIYISHLKNPAYFPMNNTLKFENPKAEGLTVITHFRDILVAFTSTSIQSLTGKSPADYARTVLNTKVGCIAPYSTAIIDNYIAFLSFEGVYILKSLAFSTDMANVQKIDIKISNIITSDKNACGVAFEDQYHLVFPSQNMRLRYYYQYGIWTKDVSDKLNLCQLQVDDGELYALGNDGAVYRFDGTVWDDDGFVYEDSFVTKGYDFGMPYNPKKLKELQVLVAHFNETVKLSIEVLADSATVLTTDTSYASVDSNGNVIWNAVDEPNLSIDPGTIFGQWDMGTSAFGHVLSSVEKFKLTGKCKYTKVTVSHNEATQNQFLGFGFIYKVKKPK